MLRYFKIKQGVDGMNNIEEKRRKEQRVVEEMIVLYCRKNHGSKEGVCKECRELLEYAKARSEKCPFMEQKSFCSNCRVHCYKPAMRERIRQVMRFSGPRMLFYHPLLALWHVGSSVREKKLKKNLDTIDKR